MFSTDMVFVALLTTTAPHRTRLSQNCLEVLSLLKCHLRACFFVLFLNSSLQRYALASFKIVQ